MSCLCAPGGGRPAPGTGTHGSDPTAASGPAEPNATSPSSCRPTVPAEDIDRAYRAKYGRYGDTYVGPMTGPGARAATVRLMAR